MKEELDKQNKLKEGVDQWNEYFQNLRGKVFNPVLKFLTFLKIDANFLSLLKLINTFISAWILTYHFKWGLLLLILATFWDFLDGPLARYQGKASDRGKFIDVLTDNCSYVLVLLALIWIFPFASFVLAWHLFIIPAIYLLLAVYQNENEESDWVMKPASRSSYYKVLPFLGLYALGWGWIPFKVFLSIIFFVSVIASLHFLILLFLFTDKHEKHKS